MTQTAKSKVGDIWTPFGDVAVSQVRAVNERTGELRSLVFNQVKPAPGNKTVIGLRRFQLEEMDNGNFRETGTENNDKKMWEQLVDFHRQHGYLWDPPNVSMERRTTADEKQAMVDKLMQQMSTYPFDFRIVGIQRRFLWYFNDGANQQLYQTMSFHPDAKPFTDDGELRPKYQLHYDAAMEAARAPIPQRWVEDYGQGQGLHKCLYRGPAWVVRFALDDQDVLPSCRAYVRDDGIFIASDWCQRHDFTTYRNGVNLQSCIFTLSEWIVGSVLQKVGRDFRPKNGQQTEVTKMSAAIAQGITVVPEIKDILAKHLEKEKANIPKDALPIVPDVLIPAEVSEEVSLEAEKRAREHFTRVTLRAMKIAEQRQLLERLQQNGKVEGMYVELNTELPAVMHVSDGGALVTSMVVPENKEQELGYSIAQVFRIEGKRARAGHEHAEFFWCRMHKMWDLGTTKATAVAEFEKLKKKLDAAQVPNPTPEDTMPSWWLGLDQDGSPLFGGSFLKLIDGIEPCLTHWHGSLVLDTYKNTILPALVRGAEPEEAIRAAR